MRIKNGKIVSINGCKQKLANNKMAEEMRKNKSLKNKLLYTGNCFKSNQSLDCRQTDLHHFCHFRVAAHKKRFHDFATFCTQTSLEILLTTRCTANFHDP